MTHAPLAQPGLFDVEGPPAAAARPHAGVYPAGVEVRRSATIVGDRDQYRLVLWREWGSHPAGQRSQHVATFIMLNPSTADAEQDDPTIRRCVGFARALGCDGLVVGNLYAYRAVRPADLWTYDGDPTGGQRNDDVLQELALGARARRDPLIAAWGGNARPDRVDAVRRLRGMDRLTALAVTLSGAPKHPVYLPATARPVPWPDPTREDPR